MTNRQLIAALGEECRTTEAKVEDFLNALKDLCQEALKNGQRVALGKIGDLVPWKRVGDVAIKFRASAELRNGIGLADKYTVAHGALCIECHNRPHAPRRALCYACKRARERKRKKGRQGDKETRR